MAFTLQLDTPVAGANAYVDVTYFRAYHADRGRTFTELDAVIQTWIVQGTDYLDTRHRYKGERLEETQTTEFPRKDLYDDRGDDVVGIPSAVKDATCEYSLRARTAALMPDPTLDASGRAVVKESSGVGPIEESKEYANPTLGYLAPSYPAADRLLINRGLVRKTASGIGGGSVGRG